MWKFRISSWLLRPQCFQSVLQAVAFCSLFGIGLALAYSQRIGTAFHRLLHALHTKVSNKNRLTNLDFVINFQHMTSCKLRTTITIDTGYCNVFWKSKSSETGHLLGCFMKLSAKNVGNFSVELFRKSSAIFSGNFRKNSAGNFLTHNPRHLDRFTIIYSTSNKGMNFCFGCIKRSTHCLHLSQMVDTFSG